MASALPSIVLRHASSFQPGGGPSERILGGVLAHAQISLVAFECVQSVARPAVGVDAWSDIWTSHFLINSRYVKGREHAICHATQERHCRSASLYMEHHVSRDSVDQAQDGTIATDRAKMLVLPDDGAAVTQPQGGASSSVKVSLSQKSACRSTAYIPRSTLMQSRKSTSTKAAPAPAQETSELWDSHPSTDGCYSVSEASSTDLSCRKIASTGNDELRIATTRGRSQRGRAYSAADGAHFSTDTISPHGGRLDPEQARSNFRTVPDLGRPTL